MRTVLVLIACFAALSAAEGERFARNGEMPVPEGTTEHWATQSAAYVPGDGPGIDGYHMWRGRADRDYLPFHQWELRLRGGPERVSALRLRVIVLGGDLQPLGRSGIGHWVELGSLPADAQRAVSYKLNCAAPTAVRIELAWQGGDARLLSIDAQSLPEVEVTEKPDRPVLRVVEPTFQLDARRKRAAFRFYLRNDGGRAATGVVHTVILRDNAGKELHRVEHVPTDDGTVPPGFAEQITFIARDVPAFSTIRVTTRKDEPAPSGSETGAMGGLDPGTFTGAGEVEVAEVVVDADGIHARVRNGLDQRVVDLRITLELLGADGGLLAAVPIPVGELDPGASAPISAALPADLGTVHGWGVASEFGVAGPGDPAPPDATEALSPEEAEGEVVSVNGLVLSVGEGQVAEGVLRLPYQLLNRRSEDLRDLRCTFRIEDDTGAVTPVTVTLPALASGATVGNEIVVEGVGSVVRVGLEWSAGD